MNVTNDICSNLDITYIPPTERIIYGSCFIMVFSALMAANSLLLYKMYYMTKRTSGDVISAVLSIADLSVGIIAVPNICFKILLFETFPWVIPCRPFIFLLYFPTSISWLLVTVAALDRCLLVLRPISYSIWINNRRLCWIVIISIAYMFIVTLVVLLTDNKKVVQLTAAIFQTSCILLILCSYMLLICCFYYKKSQMKGKIFRRKCKSSLTRNIIYIIICQVICVSPLTIILFVLQNHEEEVVKYKMNYLPLIFAYSSSFINPLITMRNECFKERLRKNRKNNNSCGNAIELYHQETKISSVS